MSGIGRLFGSRRSREERSARERDEREAADAAAAVRDAGSEEQERVDRLSRLALWTDSHCHLQATAEPVEALVRAQSAGTRRMILVGTDADGSRAAIAAAASLQAPTPPPVELWATIGLHPHDASRGLDEVSALLDEVASAGLSRARVVAVGECGLDYHYDHSPRESQRAVFAAQVGLAHRHGLALVIHTREAWDDTFSILKTEGMPDRTVFHCFTGGPLEAKACLDMGAYLSFSGIVTFANATELREAVRLTPTAQMLVETDAPFLTPVPHRGKPNEPAYVPLVGAALAELKGVELIEMAAATTANAAVVFGLHG